MEAQLQKTYARLRAENPTLGALNAIRWARGELRNAAAMQALGVPAYCDDRGESFEFAPGYVLEYRAESDCTADFADRSGLRVTWERGYGRPFEHAAECWIDRNGVTQWAGDRARDWARIESDYPLAERVANNRKLGMSRHLAWIAARESLAREFALWREYWRSRESWLALSVSIRGPDGETLAHDSICGVESGGDYWRECLADMADGLLSAYLKDCGLRIDTARRAIRATRAHARRLAAELRGFRGIVAPESCAVLREKLAGMRAAVGAAARDLRASKEIARVLVSMGV